MTLRFVSVLAALTLLLAGCGHMPIWSMYKLSQLDPASVDLGGLRAAVRVPDPLRPAKVTLELGARTHAGPKPHIETFILEPDTDLSELAALRGENVPGARHYIYRIAAADIARAERFRSDIAAYRAAGGSGGGGQLSIGAEACRAGRIPDGPLLLTTYLKFEAADGYIPVARDLDLRSYVEEKALREEIPPCA